ncbi:MAG TPA: 3-hydroxyacyl-CoA dehydrogenase [Fibrobacteres bacterium]|mgnify:CR=1 FL=1|jgi:3-hydroxyacyl-CoA dehydrogenase|nr:3-hydroxyacyl-CoA dehydrogenase [Fibrobacterota bacterium]
MNAIRTATVIGSGVMGAQIAAHLAGCGIRVLLLDIPAEGANRNALAEKAKANLSKIKPSPFYSTEALHLIRTGNTADDLKDAGETDWIIEAIVEQPNPKRELFAKLQSVMGSSTILSTNTSGIPLKILCKDLNQDVQSRFIGTHFFNPPRYLRLVEVIRGPLTSNETVERINHVLTDVLNKVPVPALDSPAFIANRIGVHAMAHTLRIARELDLTIEEVDAITGPLMARPKTATFKLADLVGIDVLLHILRNLQAAFPDEGFSVDPLLEKLLTEKKLGRKTGAGFYRKNGETLEVLDLKTGEYHPEHKTRFEELKAISKAEDPEEKIRLLFAAHGRGAEAAQHILKATLEYAAKVASHVAEHPGYVDEAMELGFGWELGPFKIMAAVGANNYSPLPPQPISRGFNLARWRKEHKPVLANSDATLWDIGDNVLLLEFHSKMNTMGPLSLDMILKSVEKANNGQTGLVIGNHGQHFCAGANIAMLLLDAANGEFENIDAAIRQFQTASMAIKYSGVPVVVAPHSMALGGGCEFVLHSPRPLLSPETYLGLVEVGVGLLPAGGGTKELTLRALNKNRGGIPLLHLSEAFKLIATAKVSTSAREAFEFGYLDARAGIATNETTRLDQAKAEVLAMSRAGYHPPAPATHIEILGTEALGAFETAIYLMREAGFASEHDERISKAVARIMAGGAVTPGTIVDEDYLLELEREEFLSLVATKKSQERIAFMLKTGKPLRN